MGENANGNRIRNNNGDRDIEFDPMFEYILARSRTRESSTLTVATVAASASLVLLGLYLQVLTDEHWKENVLLQVIVIIMGSTFAIAGPVYRKATTRTIHDNDDDWLATYVRNWRTFHQNAIGERIIGQVPCHRKRPIEDPLSHHRASRWRTISLAALLITPIIAWSTVIIVPIISINPSTVAVGIAFALIGSFDLYIGLHE